MAGQTRASRRSILKAGGYAASALALAACGATPAPTSQPVAATQAPAAEATATVAPAAASGEKTKVVLAWWSVGAEADKVYDQTLATAAEALPDIAIEQQIAPWADFWQKSQTQAAGGVPPDVTLMSVAYVAQYAKDGWLRDLSPYIERDSVDMTKYYTSAVDQWRFAEGRRMTGEGNSYCMPVDISGTIFIYNKKIFDEAGVAYPDDTWDWDKIVEVGTALTKDTTGAGKPDQYGMRIQVATDMILTMLTWQNDGELFDADYTKSLMSDKKVVEAVQWQVDLIHKHKVSPVPDPAVMVDLWQTGKIGMEYDFQWNLVSWKPITDFGYDIAPLPIGPSGKRITCGEADGMGISGGTKNPDAAWQVLKWMTGPGEKGPEELLRMGWGPAVKELAYSDLYLKQEGWPANVLEAVKQLDQSRPPYVGLGWMEVFFTAMQSPLEAAWLGQMTAQEACDAAAKAVDEVLARV
jgi:multiple sugar transport system substrate-binding protein